MNTTTTSKHSAIRRCLRFLNKNLKLNATLCKVLWIRNRVKLFIRENLVSSLKLVYQKQYKNLQKLSIFLLLGCSLSLAQAFAFANYSTQEPLDISQASRSSSVVFQESSGSALTIRLNKPLQPRRQIMPPILLIGLMVLFRPGSPRGHIRLKKFK